jgi:hypothetical protein
MVVDPPFTSTTPPPGNYDFTLEVLDIYNLNTSIIIPCSAKELPIQALVKNDHLGNSPATPSLAITFGTLELFRRMRLRKSSFSVEAFVKVVCDLYSVCLCYPGAYPHQLIKLTGAISPALPFVIRRGI